MAANVDSRPVGMRPRSITKNSLPSIFSGRRMGSIMLYTTGAMILAVFCSFLFSALGQDTEFAIAIMGSLIGGFLGALLAVALIIDIYLPKRERDAE